jgi:hypothetical protein
MKFPAKSTFIFCLFSLSAILGPWALAEQATPAQQATPTAAGSATTGAPDSASNATSKPSEDTIFRGVKIADAKGKQSDALLIFSDSSKKLVVRVADQDFVATPYDQLDKFSYEYTKKHRVTQGAIVMVASLGAGAIVMLTKSKSHWLYIDFHEQAAPKSIVLRMDKNQYRSIIDAVKTHTGKEVEFLKEGERKSKENIVKTKAPEPAIP